MRLPQIAKRVEPVPGEAPGGRLAWRLVLGIAVLGVAAFALVAWDAYRSGERQAERLAIALAATAEQDIRRNLDLLDLSMQVAIGHLELPAVPDASSQAHNRALMERLPRDEYVGFIDALDANGDLVAGSPASRQGKNWADRDYFRALVPPNAVSPFIGKPYATSTEASIPIARRLPARDGAFTGVMVAGMRLAYVRELFNRLGLGGNDTAALLRDDGTILMRFPFDRNLLGDRLAEGAPLYAFLRTGVTPLLAADPVDRVERQFVFRKVGSLPLVVSIGVSRADVHAAALAQLWLPALALASCLGLTALFAAMLSRAQQRHQAAVRDSQEKSRFLTVLSHELRTPLHGVLGYADQLSRDRTLGGDQLQQVAEIVRGANHMRDVVNVVLDYARIEALGPALHMRRLDVRALAEDCLAVVRPSAMARGLDTRLTVAAGAPGRFVTDGVQLRQILTNLLSNAVKYTPEGWVALHLMGDDGHLRIEVSDTGIGIPEGQRHRLFKEYERFGTERTSIEGTGLGLAIAHRLARRMGGHLGHRNNPGGGSVFWLELPAGVEDAPEAAAAPADAAPSARGLNVLVVDDFEINGAVAAAYLREGGHRASVAGSGEAALKLAAAQDFDVVLMDMRMAGMDGLEATRRIRALDGPRGQVPIVAVTANALDQHAEDCRRAGMSEHLAKPFTRAELMAVIARATLPRAAVDADADTADGLAQLTANLGREHGHLLDCLALRIEALLRGLEDPTALASPEALADLAHELVGSGGTLGFTRLATAAARFERTGAADPHDLQQEAKAALAKLRARRSIEAILAG